MEPFTKLDSIRIEGNRELALYRRGHAFYIHIDREQLMSSDCHGSEEALAQLSCTEVPADGRVLIGGLGMGFTLRATLDCVGPAAVVTVAELFPAVVRWNQSTVGHVAGDPLSDRRARIFEGDVYDALKPKSYHSILLDVDNGPNALCLPSNQRLYGDVGMQRLRGALRDNGVLALWCAEPDDRFARRFEKVGFAVTSHTARGQGKKGRRHAVIIGRRRAG